MLGRAERVARRRVHHHDAQPRGGFLVDVVGADAGPRDRPQAAIPFQHVAADRDAAAADRAVELGQRLFQRLALQAGADFVLDARASRSEVEAFLGDGVENDDLGHGDRPLCLKETNRRARTNSQGVDSQGIAAVVPRLGDARNAVYSLLANRKAGTADYRVAAGSSGRKTHRLMKASNTRLGKSNGASGGAPNTMLSHRLRRDAVQVGLHVQDEAEHAHCRLNQQQASSRARETAA